MDQKVYVCTGTCQAEVTEEQYQSGIVKCGTGGCTMEGHTFEERRKCSVCGQTYKPEETHSH
ncbi:hypothetical protein HY345_01620 [Candidatus Microgenomates bacterium]|nr:hypothetical protein [Candidatus Microgenomates bacterium]